jgi:uncharacterized protein YjgD (DUF1641 family)
MAQPIAFDTAPRDARQALREKVERAPADHAEAVLAAYEVLQQLHDRGILDVVRSGLAAGDELLDNVAAIAGRPETIRAMRNVILCHQVLGRIEPEWFRGIVDAIPGGRPTSPARPDERIGLWRLLRRATSKDSLRGLAAGVAFLESFGRHLRVLESSGRPPARS